MTGPSQHEIMTSLAAVAEEAQRHVAKLDRHRALKAIEHTIAEFPGLPDLSQSLGDIRDRVRGQLDQTPEVRALRAVERMIPELSGVLAFLAERETPDRPVAAADPVVPQPQPVAPAVMDTAPVAAPPGAPIGEAPVAQEPVAQAPVAEAPVAEPAVAEIVGDPAPGEGAAVAVISDEAQADLTPPPDDLSLAPSAEGGAPSLAYSLAQMMVQAMVPPASASPPEEVAGAVEAIQPVADGVPEPGPVDHAPEKAA